MNAPLTDQQQSAIVSPSHAVAEQPYPNNLAQDQISRKYNGGLTVSTKDSAFEDSQAVKAVLVNMNQFYKWFTDLELAMKSETEEKYHHYVNTLTERIQTCDDILHQLVEKQRLIEFAEALRSKLRYFDELENWVQMLQLSIIHQILKHVLNLIPTKFIFVIQELSIWMEQLI